MPHVIVFTHYNNLAKGPTYVANDDTLLLDYLGATPPQNPQQSSVVNESPTQVLDKLEQRGYRVVGMSSNASDTFTSYVWTLHKPEEIEPFP
ncbi:GTP cyclohydrolase 1 feedback regulatory protein-like [Oppia nitens]|uniref:GTP cyclohydrolase 1 feedback regulatory protein-like n=1 Tax=Oppia nitens TaxID=1686743 RepID=UPI0023D9EB38|nr:GTP cyclohydrolase 1 feedback regulatory protein-like [Oppia nitens]